MNLYFILRPGYGFNEIAPWTKFSVSAAAADEFAIWAASWSQAPITASLPYGEVPVALMTGVIDVYVTEKPDAISYILDQLEGAVAYDGVGNQIDEHVSPPAPSYVVDVALLYEAGFAREADIGGLNYWIDLNEEGMDPVTMAALLLNSDEFTQRFGDDDAMTASEFVNLMYMNVLSRPGEAAGVDYWVGQMSAGASREAVLLNFAASNENVEGSTVSSLVEASPGYWTFG